MIKEEVEITLEELNILNQFDEVIIPVKEAGHFLRIILKDKELKNEPTISRA